MESNAKNWAALAGRISACENEAKIAERDPHTQAAAVIRYYLIEAAKRARQIAESKAIEEKG